MSCLVFYDSQLKSFLLVYLESKSWSVRSVALLPTIKVGWLYDILSMDRELG